MSGKAILAGEVLVVGGGESQTTPLLKVGGVLDSFSPPSPTFGGSVFSPLPDSEGQKNLLLLIAQCKIVPFAFLHFEAIHCGKISHIQEKRITAISLKRAGLMQNTSTSCISCFFFVLAFQEDLQKETPRN